MERDWRDDRIAEQDRRIAEQDAIIATLTAQLAQALARIENLEEQLKKSSRNSSKPPSGDGPSVPPVKKRATTGRAAGGQKGHPRNERALVPVDQVDEVIDVRPTRCRGCDARLVGHDASPQRHQTFELPKVKPFVSEHRLYTFGCVCGVSTTASLPPGVPNGAFGPNVVATVGTLMGVFRLSKRAVVELLREMFGLELSVGAVVGCQRLASRALAAPVADAHAFAKTQPVKHADETPWRESRNGAWLWTLVTASVTVFLIHARRNADVARELLGCAIGVLVTDRHGGYNFWPEATHQFCWAHLKRDIIAISERGGDSERIGKAMLEEVARMFTWWHRVRDGTLARSTFVVYMRSVQKRIHALLQEGSSVAQLNTQRTCKKLLKHKTSLWTFVRISGVEPTNNAAERSVRHGVLCRKVSFGTRSAEGSRFIERMLTVRATLRQQKRSVLAFMRDACHAALAGSPAPSLLSALPTPLVEAPSRLSRVA